MADPWFKPKTYGYGASPANWKGWVAVLVYGLVVLLFTWALIVVPARDGSGPGTMQVALFLALSVAVTGTFIRITRARTDGEWRWRWGKDGGDGT